jgi:hypothetical protein
MSPPIDHLQGNDDESRRFPMPLLPTNLGDWGSEEGKEKPHCQEAGQGGS